jgi:hypothetical protein
MHNNDARIFTDEEWNRLCTLIADRQYARVVLMRDTLRGIVASDPGGEITVSTVALDGVLLMVEDIFKELTEAIEILDF